MFAWLVLLLLNSVSVLGEPPKLPVKPLHSVLTRDELVHYLETDSHEKVPDYDVIPVSPHRRKRSTNKGHKFYKMTAFGKNFDLHLEPYDEGVHPGLIVERRGAERMIAKEVYKQEGPFYHGHVVSDPGSVVAVRETGESGQLSGSILSGDHVYKLEPIAEHIKRKASIRGTGQHVISKRSLSRPTKKSGGPPIIVAGVSKQTSVPVIKKRMVPKVIEYMITLDKPTSDYFNNSAMNYVLNLANMVNRLFGDPSMGFDLTSKLVKVFIIQGFEPMLDFQTNDIRSGGSYLGKFRTWARTQNTAPATAGHFDNGVLVTRRMCGMVSCSLNGLAYFDVPCSSHYGFSINDAQGLGAAFSIAHEMGHNLGADHDYGICAGHIMSAGQPTGAKAFTWSSCSSEALKKRFSRVTCYDNQPVSLQITTPVYPPGYYMDGTRQCQMMYGPTYSRCPIASLINNCQKLVCFKGSTCVSRGGPPVDGTSCGKRKWCMKGKCVDVGNGLPPPVNGMWGSWGAYSACSRTCGGGVRHRIRKCDKPRPQFHGDDCIGTHQGEWEVCKQAKCTSGNHREEQCKKRGFETDYYKGVIPCTLYCRRGNIAESVSSVADGTRCSRDEDVQDVCIKGKCEEVGCDSVLKSGNPIDRCAKCGMDGNQCVLGNKLYTDQSHRVYGPKAAVVMFRIPAGATTVVVQELGETNNFMSLKLDPPQSSPFLIPVPSWSRTVYAAGATIKYYMSSYVYAERITIKGPTTQPLNVMYIYIGYYSNPGFKLTYYSPGQGTSTKFVWKVESSATCSKTCAGGQRINTITCYREDDKTLIGPRFCDQGTKPPSSVPCNTQPCNPKWTAGDWGICSKSCAGGNHTRSLTCTQKITQNSFRKLDFAACSHIKRPNVSRNCNEFDCPVMWMTGPWSECTAKCRGNQTRSSTCQQTLASGTTVTLSHQMCTTTTGMTPAVTQVCNHLSCYEWKVEYSCQNCSAPPKAYMTIGCFKDYHRNVRPLPTSIGNHRNNIDWKHMEKTVKQCSEDAWRKKMYVFGVQFYGECWSGPLGYKSYGIDGRYPGGCWAGVGGDHANFVYAFSSKVVQPKITCHEDISNIDDSDDHCDASKKPQFKLKLCSEQCKKS